MQFSAEILQNNRFLPHHYNDQKTKLLVKIMFKRFYRSEDPLILYLDDICIGGSRGGGARDTPLPWGGSKFFHFHAFFGKKWLAHPLWELASPQENPRSATDLDTLLCLKMCECQGRVPPLEIQFFSFSCIFRQKMVSVPHPLWELASWRPLRKILDPPLIGTLCCVLK